MTLMPVSNISVVGVRFSTVGAVAVDRPALLDLDRLALVDDVAEHVEDAAERHLADGHRDRAAGVLDLHAAGQAVGRVHGDRADAVVAEVLLHLADEPLVAGRRRRPRSPRSASAQRTRMAL